MLEEVTAVPDLEDEETVVDGSGFQEWRRHCGPRVSEKNGDAVAAVVFDHDVEDVASAGFGWSSSEICTQWRVVWQHRRSHDARTGGLLGDDEILLVVLLVCRPAGRRGCTMKMRRRHDLHRSSAVIRVSPEGPR